MAETQRVKLPPRALAKIERLAQERDTANLRFTVFLTGVLDGLGLDTEHTTWRVEGDEAVAVPPPTD